VNVTFYDVQPDARIRRIATLVNAAWERGKRLLVTCSDVEEAEALDQLIWTFDDGAFIPHEIVSMGEAPKDPDARVILVTEEHDPIGAEILLQAAPVSRAFAQRYAYVIDLVDHRSQEALDASRGRYKDWAKDGFRPNFVKR
jgi:DNA polymerase III subunit chi